MPELGCHCVFSSLPICLAGAGCIFHVIGLSSVYWLVNGHALVSRTRCGLWTEVSSAPCSSYPIVPDYIKTSRAFVILGLLAGVGGLVLSVISLVKQQKTYYRMACVACFLAAGCILIAVINYALESKYARPLGWEFGLGFILCCISVFLFVPAGVLNLLESTLGPLCVNQSPT
ncbi:hypothetical protein SNE40_022602 [Patella caerulea]|uniref:Uncharacterized protein n=1 Tax=Patella caerulea TaxID=87958 RepID=A0AAN8IVZ4_PATCE